MSSKGGKRIKPGDTVKLTGLKSAVQYNGLIARVAKLDAQSGRLVVECQNSGEVLAIKPANVVAYNAPKKSKSKAQARRLQIGDEVRIVNLTKAAQYNDKIGIITAEYNRRRGRYSVKLQDSNVVLGIAPKNLRFRPRKKQKVVHVQRYLVVHPQGASVRETIELDSMMIGGLKPGSSVLVSVIKGRRANIVRPIKGWVSLHTADNKPILSYAYEEKDIKDDGSGSAARGGMKPGDLMSPRREMAAGDDYDEDQCVNFEKFFNSRCNIKMVFKYISPNEKGEKLLSVEECTFIIAQLRQISINDVKESEPGIDYLVEESQESLVDTLRAMPVQGVCELMNVKDIADLGFKVSDIFTPDGDDTCGFYADFTSRVNLKNTFMRAPVDNNGQQRLQPRNAKQILSQFRGVPFISIKDGDLGIELLINKSYKEITALITDPQRDTVAALNGNKVAGAGVVNLLQECQGKINFDFVFDKAVYGEDGQKRLGEREARILLSLIRATRLDLVSADDPAISMLRGKSREELMAFLQSCPGAAVKSLKGERIYVTLVNNNSRFPVDITINATVQALKEIISEIKGVNEEDQHIIYAGKKLTVNSYRLRDYGIPPGGQVILVSRSKEGNVRRLTVAKPERRTDILDIFETRVPISDLYDLMFAQSQTEELNIQHGKMLIALFRGRNTEEVTDSDKGLTWLVGTTQRQLRDFLQNCPERAVRELQGGADVDALNKVMNKQQGSAGAGGANLKRGAPPPPPPPQSMGRDFQDKLATLKPRNSAMNQTLLNAIGPGGSASKISKILITGFHPSLFEEQQTNRTLQDIWRDRVFTQNEVLNINFQATRNQAIVIVRGDVSEQQIRMYDQEVRRTMEKLAAAIPKHLTSVLPSFEETARNIRAQQMT